MERSSLALLLALNVLAIGVLYGRFSNTAAGIKLNLSLQSALSSLFPSSRPTCGLVHWDEYKLISERVVLPSGTQPAALHIQGGKIVHISDDVTQTGPKVLKFKDAVISPGVIDVHAHLNEPGREEWEGIQTGTRAAALGGVTTVVDMPLNSFPVTTTTETLKAKKEAAQGKATVDIAYWAGLVPGNARDHSALRALLYQGAVGFKSFMCPSGIDDFPHVEPADIAAALPLLKQAGVPFFVHAERVDAGPGPGEVQGDTRSYSTYVATRPPAMEQSAIRALVEVLDADSSPAKPGFRVHIAHLADAGSLPLIQEAQQRGHPISVETCAHYLTFSSEDIPDGATQFKCAPPIRDAPNREALRQAAARGTISIISSDHSPAPPSLKETESGNFLKAWGGISGLQYLLPATWTALSSVGVTFNHLAALLSEQPARLAGLSHRKGRIAEGYDADIVVWEPESPANTSTALNHHRHKLSPYTDMPLKGRVIATVVQGHFVALLDAVSKHACGTPVGHDLK